MSVQRIRKSTPTNKPHRPDKRNARSSSKHHPSQVKSAPLVRQRIPGARKIQTQELPAFSRQLAAMLSAGMPITESLNVLHHQVDTPHFKPLIARIKAHIENGCSLSEALTPYDCVFDELYVNMVRGGESGGQLAETIDRLAGFLENREKLKRKLKGAMMYPIIVLIVAISISIAMIVFIVPVFADMFAGFKATLPAPTRFLVHISGLMRSYGPLLLIGSLIGSFAYARWKTSSSGAMTLDRLTLHSPIMGTLARKIASARFARTFSQLIRSGVPILSALDIVSGATGNRVAGALILEARRTVEQGECLSSAMTAQTVFPQMLVRMLHAGEKTGKVDEMLDNIADFYEDEVETALDGLTSMIEPLLMIFMGVVVGFILIAMFLPMFQLGEIVSKGF